MSGGRIGLQMELIPVRLEKLVDAKFESITKQQAEK
ncbi:hypothetical protein EVA_04975 [gut metagenome]|uniref:Uncharacterized protein n=1 Tax=gut metagenome TaxID=749906 RepID=J9GHG0_9ZZZZ